MRRKWTVKVEEAKEKTVQRPLDFGILQRRRASLKPGESVGKYDVGDEGDRTGLRARKAGMKEEGRERERKNERENGKMRARARNRERKRDRERDDSGWLVVVRAREEANRSSGDALYVGG